MPAEEEKLDDVIADLIDNDEDEEQLQASPLPGFDAAPDIEISGPPVELTERSARQVHKIRKVSADGSAQPCSRAAAATRS